MNLEPIMLEDAASGASAKILSGYGFNCYSFRPALGGQPIEVLWAAPDFASGQSKASHSGIPILFPFPGRLRGSHLSYRGQTYPLGSDDGLGNGIHGFVLSRPWRIVEHLPQRATGEFHASVDEPGLLRRWPADFRLSVSYEVAGSSLNCEIAVHNPGKTPLPFGLGLHPYFRVPLGPGGKADDCVITVPAAEYWELADMLPTGRKLPADGSRALSSGLKFGQAKLDDVFTKLSYEGDVCRTQINDPHTGRILELTFDKSFSQCVVYNPPHREAVCIEPYTDVPDAFNLEAEDIRTGLRVLSAGESFSTRFTISLK
jgi:aldose 1-epimerase